MPWLCSPWSGGSTDHLDLMKNFGVQLENLNFQKNGKFLTHVFENNKTI